MTTFPAVLTAPGTNTFTDYDGIQVTYVGEDAGMVALGHHDLDAARDAFAKHDTPFGWDFTILTTWAVLVDRPEHDCVADDTTSCMGCEEAYGVPWWMQWNVTEDTPGAFTVMVVEA